MTRTRGPSTRVFGLLFAGVALLCCPARSDMKRIEDNSFLLDEAYNQDDRIIQHVQTFQYYNESTWLYSFTDEWPVGGRKHQLSGTILAAHVMDGGEGTGFGDLGLNYRYQLLDSEQIAMAPRISLIIPVGDWRRNLGTGALGYQVNLPLSLAIGKEWRNHWNLGAIVVPSAKSPSGYVANTTAFNFGTSFIYLYSPTVNFMVELFGVSGERVISNGVTERTDLFLVNPGMRFAINFKAGLQIVPGFSVPIGVGPSAGSYGGLLYLSIEHGI